MNKAELIEAIAGRVTVSKKMAEEVLNATIDSIVEAVANGDKVTLVGFGTFEKRDRKEREGRNPQTQEKLLISATSVPSFSPGKNFKQTVSGASEQKELVEA